MKLEEKEKNVLPRIFQQRRQQTGGSYGSQRILQP